jgi:DNA-binding MarR family transcriptional regulator
MPEDPAGAAARRHGQPDRETQDARETQPGEEGQPGEEAWPGGGTRPGGESRSGQNQPGGQNQPDWATRPDWAARPGWETPWPESPAMGRGRPERADLEVAFAAGLRRTGALMQLMGSAAAEKIGINATDLVCLNILSFSGHMTAGELARATGLTTASITGVVDRLEEAGFVTRERDPRDRRRVVVQINLDRAMRDVAAVFVPMLRAWRDMASRYSDDELRLIVDFYARMEQVLRDHVVRLRGGPEPAGP